MQVISAQGCGGVILGQHLTDQLFQALANGIANPSDPTLVATFKDAWERVPSSRLFDSPFMLYNLESLNWDEVGSDLDGERIDNLTALVDYHRQGEASSHRTPPTDQHAADRAALDQYFAQTSDYPDELKCQSTEAEHSGWIP